MEQLLRVESQLIGNLNSYADELEQKLHVVRRLVSRESRRALIELY